MNRLRRAMRDHLLAPKQLAGQEATKRVHEWAKRLRSEQPHVWRSLDDRFKRYLEQLPLEHVFGQFKLPPDVAQSFADAVRTLRRQPNPLEHALALEHEEQRLKANAFIRLLMRGFHEDPDAQELLRRAGYFEAVDHTEEEGYRPVAGGAARQDAQFYTNEPISDSELSGHLIDRLYVLDTRTHQPETVQLVRGNRLSEEERIRFAREIEAWPLRPQMSARRADLVQGLRRPTEQYHLDAVRQARFALSPEGRVEGYVIVPTDLQQPGAVEIAEENRQGLRYQGVGRELIAVRFLEWLTTHPGQPTAADIQSDRLRDEAARRLGPMTNYRFDVSEAQARAFVEAQRARVKRLLFGLPRIEGGSGTDPQRPDYILSYQVRSLVERFLAALRPNEEQLLREFLDRRLPGEHLLAGAPIEPAWVVEVLIPHFQGPSLVEFTATLSSRPEGPHLLAVLDRLMEAYEPVRRELELLGTGAWVSRGSALEEQLLRGFGQWLSPSERRLMWASFHQPRQQQEVDVHTLLQLLELEQGAVIQDPEVLHHYLETYEEVGLDRLEAILRLHRAQDLDALESLRRNSDALLGVWYERDRLQNAGLDPARAGAVVAFAASDSLQVKRANAQQVLAEPIEPTVREEVRALLWSLIRTQARERFWVAEPYNGEREALYDLIAELANGDQPFQEMLSRAASRKGREQAKIVATLNALRPQGGAGGGGLFTSFLTTLTMMFLSPLMLSVGSGPGRGERRPSWSERQTALMLASLTSTERILLLDYMAELEPDATETANEDGLSTRFLRLTLTHLTDEEFTAFEDELAADEETYWLPSLYSLRRKLMDLDAALDNGPSDGFPSLGRPEDALFLRFGRTLEPDEQLFLQAFISRTG
ncbi:MAG TPA: hypothetical protein VJB16_01520, partial [archaeon]|nr:hypothetical protein [archaeon]